MNLELPSTGEFLIGRGSTSDLALDDALVSRKHASLSLRPDGVRVSDLGSRNGVIINGDRMREGTRALKHLDRLLIGSYELVLIEIPEGAKLVMCEACRAVTPSGGSNCAVCGQSFREQSDTAANVTREHTPLAAEARLPYSRASRRPLADPASQVESFEERTGVSLLTELADKALILNRHDEAERVLGKSLRALLAHAQSGQAPDPVRVVEACRHALRLAEELNKPTWLDWVFEICISTRRLLSAHEIEQVHRLVRKLRYRGVTLKRYVETMRAESSERGPAERFLVQRLEGVAKMVF